MNISKTAFLGGEHTKYGMSFLNLLFSNVFDKEPKHAKISVLETNFGLKTGIFLHTK